MAGRIKHMERSHRSHKSNTYGVYNQFHRYAYSVAQRKESKKTLGQSLASLVKSIMPKTAAK